jgi:hypothetical protein
LDDQNFDAISRAIRNGPSRRTTVQVFGAGAMAMLLGRFAHLEVNGADAAGEISAERKRRKKKKKRCPQARRCSNKTCCKKGQICVGGRCVVGQGTCPAGTNFCLDGVTTCNGNPDCFCTEQVSGATRCASTIEVRHACGECVDDADCVEGFGAAAFCINGGPACGCEPGEGICVTACPN